MQQQQEWLRQQQEAQQAQLLAQQQQAQQEEWNRQQQQLLYQQQLAQAQQQQQQFAPLQPIAPQATGFGSNNPFAPSPSTFGQSPPPVPSLPSTSGSSGLDSFSLPSTFASSPALRPTSTPASSVSPAPSAPSPAAVPQRSDGEHAHLANLLANREDGLDTFGNIGQLRYGFRVTRKEARCADYICTCPLDMATPRLAGWLHRRRGTTRSRCSSHSSRARRPSSRSNQSLRIFSRDSFSPVALLSIIAPSHLFFLEVSMIPHGGLVQPVYEQADTLLARKLTDSPSL